MKILIASTKVVIFIVITFLFVGMCSSTRSQEKEVITGSWWDMSSTGPPGREDHKMVFDSYSNKVILFGGKDPQPSELFDDTWIYDLSSNTWNNMSPSIQPDARSKHSMVYDSNSRKMILFGGETIRSFSYVDLNDTWVYDLTTNTWTQKNPVNPPSPRNWHSMVYDPNTNKLILFGGWNEGNLGDTWTYDLSSNTWTNMSPSIQPDARSGHSMVYDADSSKVILYGGFFESEEDAFNDTWVYDPMFNTWHQMTPLLSPGARLAHSMVYDTHLARVIVFGGVEYLMGSGMGGGTLKDTWSYDLLTNTWSHLNLSYSPPAREHLSMVFNSVFNKIILFGGAGFPDHYRDGLNDTWVSDLSFTPPSEATLPAASQYLTATANYNSVKLSWLASDDGGSVITHYRVYRGTTSGNYLFLGISTKLTFTDTLRSSGIIYYYVITAVSAVGESDFSNEVCATLTGTATTSTITTTTTSSTATPEAGPFPSFLFVFVFLGILTITRKYKKT